MNKPQKKVFQELLAKARACQHCAAHLPLGPRPIIQASTTSRLVIIGQAPGSKVYQSGVPWDDPSGKRLREWLSIDDTAFYDATKVALIPMGFCYPGKGKSGDLPPRPECAPLWHSQMLNALPAERVTLLIGQYAQKYYLGSSFQSNLTKTVECDQDYLPQYSPLPHPSPRNRYWLTKNAWFEKNLVPQLQQRVSQLLEN